MRTVLVLSVVLNIVLAGWITRQHNADILERIAEQNEEISKRAFPERLELPLSTSNAFRWSSLESTDFKQYIANLKSAGCPEETIRDLISAEVNKLYAPKFMALAANGAGASYWKNRSNHITSEFRSAYGALVSEKKRLLVDLLGVAYDASENYANLPADKLMELGRYAYLGEDKLKAVQELLHKYGLREGQSWPSEMRQELAGLLTSEEMHEMELRDSNTANTVRSKFGSWDITEDEYRKLYALRKAYEDTQGEYDPNDPDKMKRRNDARQALNTAYRQELGEGRYNELFKQSDYSYQALNQLASSHNVAPTTIEQAYATQKVAMDQISKVFNDATLSPEMRKETLAALNGELERELQKLIGQTAYERYKQTGPQTTFSRGGETVVIFGNPTEGPVAISAQSGDTIMISRRFNEPPPPVPIK